MEQFITTFKQALVKQDLKFNLWQPMLFTREHEQLVDFALSPAAPIVTDPAQYQTINLKTKITKLPPEQQTIEQVLSNCNQSADLIYDNRILEHFNMPYRAIMLDAKADYFFNWYPQHLNLDDIERVLKYTLAEHWDDNYNYADIDHEHNFNNSLRTDIPVRCIVFINNKNEIILALPIISSAVDFELPMAKLPVIATNLTQIAGILKHLPLINIDHIYPLTIPFATQPSGLNYFSETLGDSAGYNVDRIGSNDYDYSCPDYFGDSYDRNAFAKIEILTQSTLKKKHSFHDLIKTLHINYLNLLSNLLSYYLTAEITTNDQVLFRPQDDQFTNTFNKNWHNVIALFTTKTGKNIIHNLTFVSKYESHSYEYGMRPFSRKQEYLFTLDAKMICYALCELYVSALDQIIPDLDVTVKKTKMVPIAIKKTKTALKPLVAASGLNKLATNLQETSEHQYYVIAKQAKLQLVTFQGHNQLEKFQYCNLN